MRQWALIFTSPVRRSAAFLCVFVTWSEKSGFWIDVFSCVYCIFASKIAISSCVYCIFHFENHEVPIWWILGVFNGLNRAFPMCLLHFSHGNCNKHMCLFTFYPLLETVLAPVGVQIELLPCVYCILASEIVISSCVYCILASLWIPLGPLGDTLGSLR